MREFKCKYPSDSKEYLLSFVLQSKRDDLYINIQGKKVDNFEDINLDEISFVERCCVLLSHLIDNKTIDMRDYRHLGIKYEKEFRTLKAIEHSLGDMEFDEESETLLIYNLLKGKKETVEEFFKGISTHLNKHI